MAELDLFDIWRSEKPELTKYTWRRNLSNKELQMGRLDFFLISVSLASNTTNQTIELGYRSDHSIITLSLAFIETPKAKTFWKFNNLLLRDKEYTKIIKNTIGEIKRQYAATPYNPGSVDTIPGESTINPALFWEMLLLEKRQKTIFKASALKKEPNSKTRELEEALKTLSENNQESSEEFIMKKEQLENIRAKTMERVLIRSKARWIGEGEKNISLFLQSGKEALNIQENDKSDQGKWDRNE